MCISSFGFFIDIVNFSSTFAKKEDVIKVIDRTLKIERFPESTDKSLKAWSAADELLLQHALTLDATKISIYHDTFGYITCHLSDYQPTSIVNLYSQQNAILKNLQLNNIPETQVKFNFPLEELENKTELVLMKVPKSVDLFELYLNQIAKASNEDTIVLCGFMTRNFSSQALKIAERYFTIVEQSKAHKKARLMILKAVKPFKQKELIHQIKLNEDSILKQYFGVFSANHIDYATQFLMEHIQISTEESKILDIGCGNGVLAQKALQLNPSSELYLTDDSYLAIESAKLNIKAASSHFYFSNHLNDIQSESIDLAISNPPFHFEYENNMDTTLSLFKETYRCLKENGRFLLVSNKHLNYATHLKKTFYKVEILASNEKFVVYECLK